MKNVSLEYHLPSCYSFPRQLVRRQTNKIIYHSGQKNAPAKPMIALETEKQNK